MSGVNGGIDYDVDLTTLPTALAERITYVQNGPDSPTSLISAAEQIAHATEEYPQTLPVLVDMLGYNNPPAARIAISALARAGPVAIPPLLTGVAAFNYSVNAYALRALAAIGDPSVLQVCLACAITGPIPNVRRAACKALSCLRYVQPKQASAAYECLMKLADGERDWGVRYAAIVGLERFVSLQLVDDDVRRLAYSVVHAAAEGDAHVLRDEQHDEPDGVDVRVSFDPTVAARATLALEKMQNPYEVSVQV
ncbi:phycocyanobilin lyase beta subunit [Gracilaria domingensis]|nr:phycocyanobilin lyase beta subunit [Gracilaria domingensis]